MEKNAILLVLLSFILFSLAMISNLVVNNSVSPQYGEIYTNKNFSVEINQTDLWYNLTPSGFSYTLGLNKGFTSGQKNTTLISPKNATYLAFYEVTYIGGNSGVYNIGLSINKDTPRGKTNAIATADNEYQFLSNSFFIHLDEGDEVNLQIKDDVNPSQSVEIYHIELNLVELK